MNRNRWLGLCIVAAALTACGGSGGAGTAPFGSGSGSGTTSGTSSGTVASNTAGSVVLALSNSTVSASQPATVTAVVKDASGSPISGALVTFALSGSSSSIGQLSTTSAVTDASGQAATTLTPANGANNGAAYVTASADTSAGTLTTKSTFTVSATNVTLSSVAAAPTSISAYGSAAINITVSGASTTSPVTLNVSSTCAASGKAVISPATLTLTSSTGSVTYQDKACGTADSINVQITGTSQQLSTNLLVSAPGTQAIQYVDVDNPIICLFGSGCASVANLRFKVVDSSGVGKAGVSVGFTLNSSVVNAADLGSTFGTTGADGVVSVAVSSRTTPTPLRVTATVTNSSPSISTVSNELTISGGLPMAGITADHTGISFAAARYSLDGNLDGDKSQISLFLRDRWGQPVIDGTSVTFVSDGGTVIPANCVTKGGTCSQPVYMYVSNPRPVNGRVHVVAFASGQEYFEDGSNGGTVNGIVDGSENYDDVPVSVCIDKNENHHCDVSNGEFVIGPLPSTIDPNSGDGHWDNTGAFAQAQDTFIFSLTSVSPMLFEVVSVGGVEICTSTPVDATYMTVTMGGLSRRSIAFCVRDGNTNGANPVMSGTTLSAVPSTSSVSVSIDNSPISATATDPTLHHLLINNASAPTAIPSIVKVDISFDLGGTHTNVKTLSGVATINP